MSEVWDFGDGTTATGCCPTHRFPADGNYTVTLTVTTEDGRTGSANHDVTVKTQDVAITKFTVPNSARSGQTRSIVISLNSRRYEETIQVRLFKSSANDPWYGSWQEIGSATQLVPVRPTNRTTDFKFSYTFAPDDAMIGKVTFRAVAEILAGRDALPADNEAISAPTKINSNVRGLEDGESELAENGVLLFLPLVGNK